MDFEKVPESIAWQAERMSDAGTVTYVEAVEILMSNHGGSAPLRPEREVQWQAEKRSRNE